MVKPLTRFSEECAVAHFRNCVPRSVRTRKPTSRSASRVIVAQAALHLARPFGGNL
jgi:hypothetical protein